MSKRVWKLQDFVAHAGKAQCARLGEKSGQVLATGGEDKKVNIWKVGKPNAVMSLQGHTSAVECLVFDKQEEVLVVGCAGGSMQVWNLEYRKMAGTLSGHRTSCGAVEFHPYGEFFASGSVDTNLKIWDLRRKSCIQTYKGHTGCINSIRFSPHGRWVATGGQDNQVKIWDLTAGKLMRDLEVHKAPIRSIAFHPKEYLLATGSADRTMKLWSLETFQTLSSTELGSSPVEAVKFWVEESSIIAASHDALRVYPTDNLAAPTDTMEVDWKGMQDMRLCASEEKLISVSTEGTQLGIWVADLQKKDASLKGGGYGRLHARGAIGSAAPGGVRLGTAQAAPQRGRAAQRPVGSPGGGLGAGGAGGLGDEDGEEEPPSTPPPPQPAGLERQGSGVYGGEKDFRSAGPYPTTNMDPFESSSPAAASPAGASPLDGRGLGDFGSEAPLDSPEQPARVARVHSGGPASRQPSTDLTPGAAGAGAQASPLGAGAGAGAVGSSRPASGGAGGAGDHARAPERRSTPPPAESGITLVQMNALTQQHPQMNSILQRRLERVRRLKDLWARGNVARISSELSMPQDHAVFCDFARAVMRQNLDAALNLDACNALLPILRDLLSSKYDDFVVTALQFIEVLLQNFSKVITDTRNSCANIPERQLDLPREERLRKCNICHDHFREVLRILPDSQIGSRFSGFRSSLQHFVQSG